MTATAIRPYRFLRIAGAFPAWRVAVMFFAAAYAAVEWHLGGQTESGAMIMLFMLPILAGTGIVSIGRTGRLDLLFGAGVERRRVWAAALTGGFLVPMALAMLLAVKAPSHLPMGEALLRAFAIAMFTGGIGFTAGLFNPRYFVGCAWIALRIGFLVADRAQSMVMLRGHAVSGTEAPFLPTLKVVVCVPEFLLEPSVPLTFIAAAIAIGAVAISISYRIVQRADLTGKRSD